MQLTGHFWIDLLVLSGVCATALISVSAFGLKIYSAVKGISAHFKERETNRIKEAASELIEQAAGALGGRLDTALTEIQNLAHSWNEDRMRGQELVAEWEIWRGGVDARLDVSDRRLNNLEAQVPCADCPKGEDSAPH